MIDLWPFRDTLTHTLTHTYINPVLTVLECVLDDVVGHAAGSHGHVRHDVEGVVLRRLQVVDDVARGVVADDNLVLFVVKTC